MKRSIRVDGHHLPPGIVRGLVQWHLRPDDARVVEDDVDDTERVERRLE